MMQTVLIVDDDISVVNSIKNILEDENFLVTTALCGRDALSIIDSEIPDVILLDILMPEIDGLELLKIIKGKRPEIPVIMISGHASIETAINAIKEGAISFIEKPLSLEKLVHEVNLALKQASLEKENEELRKKVRSRHKIIGSSEAIIKIRELIEKAGPTNGRVFISGESGTGKELIAREIHAKSRRALFPFISVNCAAIPEGLIESELFGHEKGAFTHATSRKKGKFELAHKGTLFLDEIGDMSLNTQAKLLRVLEEGKVERVGGNRPIDVDVRIIAASNKDILSEIEKNNFRSDLYYRLNVIPIHIPPLKDHPSDIPELIDYYLKFYCSEYGMPVKKISQEALELLKSYAWPGNIRELRNEVERLVIMSNSKVIDKDDLRHELFRSGPTSQQEFEVTDLKTAKENFERNYIRKCLEKARWNVTLAAKLLGVERSNLHRKMKQLGIPNTTAFIQNKQKEHKNDIPK